MATPSKVAHEYVRLDDHSLIVSNLSQNSEHLAQGIHSAFESGDLLDEKHTHILKAHKLVNEILEDLHELDALMLRKTFKSTLTEKKEKYKVVAYHEQAHVAHKKIKSRAEDKDFLERSHKALGNLQRNLEVLKRQLK